MQAVAAVLLLAPDDAAKRVRAALAYSALEHKDVHPLTGIAVSTLRRITSRTEPRGASIEELWAIADACEVPRSFMEHGFTGDSDVEETLDAVAALLPALVELAGGAERLPADAAQALSRLRGRRG